MSLSIVPRWDIEPCGIVLRHNDLLYGGDRRRDGFECSHLQLKEIKEVSYVREISLTSTSSKDHLLNNLTVPSPTISGGRMETWVTCSSPATENQIRIQKQKREGAGIPSDMIEC